LHLTTSLNHVLRA